MGNTCGQSKQIFNLKQKIRFSLIGFFIIAVILESLSAIFFLSGLSLTHYRPQYYFENNTMMQWRTEKHAWGAWHEPNMTVNHISNYFSVTYSSNSYGAADKERSPSSSRDRILVLGDSFVEGMGVNSDERLTNILENDLKTEVLNFSSAANFGPLQYQILYELLASKFDHRCILIGLLPINDFTDNDEEFWKYDHQYRARYRPYYDISGNPAYSRLPPSESEKSIFQQLYMPYSELGIFDKMKKTRRMFWIYGIVDEVYARFIKLQLMNNNHVGYNEDDPRRINNVYRSLLKIKRYLNKEVVVFFIPTYKDLEYLSGLKPNIANTSIDKLGKMLSESDIRSIDLATAFLNSGIGYDKYFFTGEGHWNRRGNLMAAKIIEEFLINNEALCGNRGSLNKK